MKSANSPFKQPSNMVSRFSQVPSSQKPRSSFPVRQNNKGQLADAGLIVPFGIYEVYPGDTFKLSPTVFVRLTTQLVPVMDNMYLDWFALFVPNRLVDTRWEQIMGERKPDPDSSIDFTTPKLPGPRLLVGQLVICLRLTALFMVFLMGLLAFVLMFFVDIIWL